MKDSDIKNIIKTENCSEFGGQVEPLIIPRRVQRQRMKGWKMPANTTYVGRPSRWGNPFDKRYGLYEAAKDMHNDKRMPNDMTTWMDYGRAIMLNEFKNWLREQIKNNPKFLEPLRGKNLACWCSLSGQCHADILLHYANAGEGITVAAMLRITKP